MFASYTEQFYLAHQIHKSRYSLFIRFTSLGSFVSLFTYARVHPLPQITLLI